MRIGLLTCLAAAMLGLTACTSRSATSSTSISTAVLYLAAQGDATISAYNATLSSGSLAALGNPLATGKMPFAIALTPSLNGMFVDNYGSNSVSAYSINSDGSLSAATGTAATGSMPMGMAIDPTGKFLFVANQGSSDISVFSLNGTSLTKVAGSPF